MTDQPKNSADAHRGELRYADFVRRVAGKSYARTRDVKRLITRLNKFALVMQVSRSLMGAHDLKRLLAEILDQARNVMSAERASIFMLDEERGEIFASVTLDGSEIRLPRGTGIIGHVADSGETVNIPDAYADSRFSRENDDKTGFRTRSILCMPVINPSNRIIGALQVLNKDAGETFTSEDEDLLSAFIGIVGVCLENVRAYEELAREKDTLEDKVVERTAELALAKAETDQILNAVAEGLFLLYRSRDNYIIGAGHSLALSSIFEQNELRSKNFLTAISTFFEPAVIDKTKLFLELMFDPAKRQDVLLKLNPLSLARAQFSATGREKYLRFRFNRVMDGTGQAARINHLMVTVSDVSHEVELQQRLERTEEQNRRHIELLLAILQSEPATLGEFLDDLDEDLRAAAGMLAAGAMDTHLLEELYRIVHSIKGNSALLNFQSLTSLAHETESAIEPLVQIQKVSAPALADLETRVQKLTTLAEELREWLKRIASFQTAVNAPKNADLLLLTLERSAQKAAAALDKEIILSTEDFYSRQIPPAMRKAVKDALVQIVRNAVAHGIETRENRLKAGKAPQGTIQLRSAADGNRLSISIRDDGCGIDTDRVAGHLIKLGLLTAAEYVGLAAEEKMHLIFRPGVSTQTGVSEFAGRGMGLSIVEQKLKEIGAEVHLDTAPGKGTTFEISLPVQDRAERNPVE